jgi:VWFA-related protein
MQYKESLNLKLAILLGYFLAFILNLSIFAQSTSDEKPRLKDFGSSVKKFGKQEKDNSKDNKKNNNPTDEETISVKTDLVVSDVLVVNKKGNVIAGLKQSDFVVTENEIPQEVGMFSFGENARIPRSIVLIIDYSGSQLPFIKSSIDAAKVLVDTLNSNDRMAIVTDDVELMVNFTKDKELLKSKLDSLNKRVQSKKTGRSEQYTALLAVLNEMFDEEDICPIIILQSDGDEYFALKTDKTAEKDGQIPPSYNSRIFGITKKKYSFEDIYSVVLKSRATIYSIVPGFSFIGLTQEETLEKSEILYERYSSVFSELLGSKLKEHHIPKTQLLQEANWNLKAQLALLDINKLSGGYLEFLEKPEDAEKVYSIIFTTINNRYLIGYYPTNQERDGKRRTVKIEVRGHPEYIVMGRKTYFAPEK